MDDLVSKLLGESGSLKIALSKDEGFISSVTGSCQLLANALSANGTIFACGNGGSTCDSMHLVEELVARYKRDRPGLKAQHLMDSSVLTCWSNDVGFDDAFRRYVETFCSRDDVLVGISTSGNSKNVISAVKEAKKRQVPTVGLLGKDGGELARLCDVAITVPSQFTERIQEVHITIIHIWLELLETRLGFA
jgi:D-sedoheptulose 7-phosphate isomerase